MTTSAGDLGPFTGLRLIHATPTVELFTGYERNGRRPVVLIALTEQAGRDPNWSAEFTDAVAKDATTLGPLDVPVHVSDLYGRRPWAASLIAPGRRGAERILAALPGVVPEGTDPSALLHRPPHAGPPHGGPPQGGGGHSPGAAPAAPVNTHPGAPQAHAANAGNPQGQQLRPGVQPPVAGSGPPAQVSAPGYHPAPGPVPNAAAQPGAGAAAQPGAGAAAQPGAGAAAQPGAGAAAQPGASSDGKPTAVTPAGQPTPPAHTSGGSGAPPVVGSPRTPTPDGATTPSGAAGGATTPSGAAGGATASAPGGAADDAKPTEPIPAVSAEPSSAVSSPFPPAPGAQSTAGGSPIAAPGSPLAAGSPVSSGPPVSSPQGTGSPGTSDTRGTPGGVVGGRGSDSARAEGAPKLGPLPPGAHNPTVPIPHTPAPASGPAGRSGPPGPGGPGNSSTSGQGGQGGPGGQANPNGPGGPGGQQQQRPHGHGGPGSGGPGQMGPPGVPSGPVGAAGPGGHGGPIGGNTGSFPVPQGLPPHQQRQRPRNNSRAVILALVAVLSVIALALCGLAAVFTLGSNDNPESAASSSVPGATAPTAAPSRNSAGAPAEAAPADSLPPFKKALPVVVTGSVFEAGEQTDLVQREGWPFAFRVPVGWVCERATVVDGTHNDGLECRPSGRTNESAVLVGIRDCDKPCDAATHRAMNQDVTGETLVEGDETTSYVERANATEDVYNLLVSHYFGPDAGGPLRWQVVVRGSGPHTDRAVIQKVANDVRTQTP